MNLGNHIPNGITCLNLLSGGLAITASFDDNFDTALIFIIAAAVFDFLDGLAARILKAYSDTGKELDSLADVVSFGLAPSLILYNFLKGFDCVNPYICYVPLALAVFSALRLAKFNLDTRQSEQFLGLPTPASALFSASMATLAVHYPFTANPVLANNYAITITVCILSLLSISNIPMMSMKFKNLKWKDNAGRYVFLCTAAVAGSAIPVAGIHWSGAVFFIFSFYILWNIAALSISKLSDK